MIWHLSFLGLIFLIAMFGVLLAGIHMLIQPQFYVGRGPVPAQSPGNVRAMGMIFIFLGGGVTAFFTAPIFLL